MVFDLNSWIGWIIVQQLALSIMRQSYVNQHAFKPVDFFFIFFRIYGHAPSPIQIRASLKMMPLGFEKWINLFLSSSAFFKKIWIHVTKPPFIWFLILILDALIMLSIIIYNLRKVVQNLHNSVIYFSRHLWPEQVSATFTIPMRTMLNGKKKKGRGQKGTGFSYIIF